MLAATRPSVRHRHFVITSSTVSFPLHNHIHQLGFPRCMLSCLTIDSWDVCWSFGSDQWQPHEVAKRNRKEVMQPLCMIELSSVWIKRIQATGETHVTAKILQTSRCSRPTYLSLKRLHRSAQLDPPECTAPSVHAHKHNCWMKDIWT